MLTLVLIGSCFPASVRAEGLRRFALLVANNDGGTGSARLYYAHDDARRLQEVLVRLGDVRPADSVLLLDGSSATVRDALEAISIRAAAARARGQRTLFIFYYSGHARDGALRLGDGAFSIDELKRRLDAVAADLRIGILDACRSGLATRTKGAYRAPAFEVQVGGSGDARGTVLLTSSSADEDSQESDHLGGSYFTHHLLSGLQGDADASGDGQITLSEGYAYAYAHTVAATAETQAGPQHPTFAYDLSGNGDVVLTDLRRRREGVVLAAAAPAGTYFLVDRDGRVRAEISKVEGEARRIGIAPGRYQIKRRLDDRLRVGTLVVKAGEATEIDEGALRDVSFSDDPVKGSGRRGPGARTAFVLGTGVQATFQAPEGALFPTVPLIEFALERRGDLGRGWVWGPGVSVGFTKAEAVLPLGETSAVLPYTTRALTAFASLLREWPGRFLTPFFGGVLTWRFYARRFDDPGLPGQFFSTFTPGLVAGGRLALGRGFFLGMRGRLSYLHYNIDQNLSLGLWDLSATFAYQP